MEIRRFETTDTLALIELFRETVHTVCRKDYSQEQLDAWAPQNTDVAKWTSRLNESHAIVATRDGVIIGFSNLNSDDYIDMFFVAAAFQSKGVGKKMYAALEGEAIRKGVTRLYSDVSLTARKFFFSMGFAIEREYSKQVDKVTFPNAIMVKQLV
jgi:putative acetyltransferase